MDPIYKTPNSPGSVSVNTLLILISETPAKCVGECESLSASQHCCITGTTPLGSRLPSLTANLQPRPTHGENMRPKCTSRIPSGALIQARGTIREDKTSSMSRHHGFVNIKLRHNTLLKSDRRVGLLPTWNIACASLHRGLVGIWHRSSGHHNHSIHWSILKTNIFPVRSLSTNPQ